MNELRVKVVIDFINKIYDEKVTVAFNGIKYSKDMYYICVYFEIEGVQDTKVFNIHQMNITSMDTIYNSINYYIKQTLINHHIKDSLLEMGDKE